MIQITPHMEIMVAVDPADFRCQIPGLEAVCRELFRTDPTNGAVFVFRNRAATSLKLLFWDGGAYWLCQRKLAKGRLKWWPKGDGAPLAPLDAQELIVLIWNGDPRGVFDEPWKRLTPLGLEAKEHKERRPRRGQGDHRRRADPARDADRPVLPV